VTSASGQTGSEYRALFPDNTFANLFAMLGGEWRIERSISDGSRFSGNAVFTALDIHSWHMREAGMLAVTSGGRYPASNCWRWRLSGLTQLEIHFGNRDGPTLYHRIELEPAGSGWVGSAHHLCGEDSYRADYVFSANHIQILHRISGPQKDIVIASVFFPAQPELPAS
jgi:hypothetical protein